MFRYTWRLGLEPKIVTIVFEKSVSNRKFEYKVVAVEGLAYRAQIGRQNHKRHHVSLVLSFGRESGSAQRADKHYAMALPLAAAAGVGAGATGGVPPEAPAAPVPPPAAPVTALPRNYQEMFSDAGHSPAPDRTREYLQG